jgi:hypothetical protein
VVKTVVDSSGSTPGEATLILVVRSNPDLSVISIADSCISFADPQTFWSSHFLERSQDGNALTEQKHRYDSLTRMVEYTLTDLSTHTVKSHDTLRDIGPYVEGPALLAMARHLARTWQSRSIPTMIGGKLTSTDIGFNGEVEETEISAVDYPIRTRKYSGVAHWTGATAGISGEFSGWVSDDAASVPVRAEMKILLGSVVIELERWCRPGWTPPPSRSYAAH